MSKRFVVIVLDGFGIGAMNDAARERPGDEKANTLRSILSDYPDMKLANLEQLGLMNAFGAESNDMKYCESANFGKSELMHFGADTFMGHQEIMGTLPKRPTMHPFQEKVDEVYQHLKENGHKVEFVVRGNLRYIVCDDYVTVADNLEADLGMCYNVTAPLDYISFEKEYEIAKLVREVVTVGRVIVFGGTGNTMEDLYRAEEIKEGKFIGIASAKSKSYEHGYQCLHLGYGVDENVQAPTILGKAGIPVTLIGKVADIVTNKMGVSISCVPTDECMQLTIKAVKENEQGFICTNVQETDLAGHSQSSMQYRKILEKADRGLGHSKHTRECVPLLVYKKGIQGRHLGIRKTLSDVGASVCEYFGVKAPQNGTSFLNKIQ